MPAITRSPAWHRSARRLAPWARDIACLRAHHSRPSAGFFSMGGKKWQGQGNWKQQPALTQWQSSWQVWPGAWTNKDRSGDGTSRDGHWRDASFPSYQATQVPAPPAEQRSPGNTVGRGDTARERAGGHVEVHSAAVESQPEGGWQASQACSGFEAEAGPMGCFPEESPSHLSSGAQAVPEGCGWLGEGDRRDKVGQGGGHAAAFGAHGSTLLSACSGQAACAGYARCRSHSWWHARMGGPNWGRWAHGDGVGLCTSARSPGGPESEYFCGRFGAAASRAAGASSRMLGPSCPDVWVHTCYSSQQAARPLCQHAFESASSSPYADRVPCPVLCLRHSPMCQQRCPCRFRFLFLLLFCSPRMLQVQVRMLRRTLTLPLPCLMRFPRPKAAPPAAVAAVGTTVGQLPQPLQPMPRAPDRTTFGKAGGRVAVKEATMKKARERSTSHPRPGPVNGAASLAEHVERKRAQALEQQSTIPAHPAGTQQFLIDDDDEPTALSAASNEMD